MESDAVSSWARDVFGGAKLGDPRRTRRLVSLAAEVARRPGGTVTATQGTSARKEGAYRFLENDHVDAKELGDAAYTSAVTACAGQRLVFVAVDQTDLTFTDRKNVRGLGPVITRATNLVRSVFVMNSLALDEQGVPVGLVDQQWWTRPEERTTTTNDKRPPEERESWNWVRALRATRERFARLPKETKPWFVMDRGGDFHGTLADALEQRTLVTIRSCYDRHIKRNGKERWLWKTLRRQPVLGFLEVLVPRSENRRSRVARLELRAVVGETRVRRKKGGLEEYWGELSCVRVREVDTTPPGEKPIEWKLLSTYPVKSFDDARLVLRSYTLRWRIEELHRTWKTGACNVEASQLRSLPALQRWATILAVVATRIERLKQLSREQPELDALEEFSRAELDAAIVLSETKKLSPGDPLTLNEAVRLVAYVGGYMNRKSDGPPGSITIRRGLERITPAAMILERQGSSG